MFIWIVLLDLPENCNTQDAQYVIWLSSFNHPISIIQFQKSLNQHMNKWRKFWKSFYTHSILLYIFHTLWLCPFEADFIMAVLAQMSHSFPEFSDISDKKLEFLENIVFKLYFYKHHMNKFSWKAMLLNAWYRIYRLFFSTKSYDLCLGQNTVSLRFAWVHVAVQDFNQFPET